MLYLPDAQLTEVTNAISCLDAWFETMRLSGGYGGPVVHWWESSLLYCGTMADWRYEGILCGYIELFRLTHNTYWLDRAKRAGDDLLAAQLSSGKFRNSSFQQGPMEGGTPHEPAVDVGLLELARVLQEIGDEEWRLYFETAQRNLQMYVLKQLWNGAGFRDMPWSEILVPNKNATIIEALILYEALSGQDMSEYLVSTTDVILSAQEKDGPRQGGIVHAGTGRHRLAISIYTARSVNGILHLYEREPHDRWLIFIKNALRFLRRLVTPHGVYWGYYPNGNIIANPRLLAGAGDILRTLIWSYKYNLCSREDVVALIELLLRAQLPSGGIRTANGFARRGSSHQYQGVPEFRDVLPVVGWCDKAFRALTLVLNQDCSIKFPVKTVNVSVNVLWKGELCVFHETENYMKLSRFDSLDIYKWQKRANYPCAFNL